MRSSVSNWRFALNVGLLTAAIFLVLGLCPALALADTPEDVDLGDPVVAGEMVLVVATPDSGDAMDMGTAAEGTDVDMEAAATPPIVEDGSDGAYLDPKKTSFAWAHDYAQWTMPHFCNLHVNDAGELERVELVDNKLIVECVSDDYRSIKWRKTIATDTFWPSNLQEDNICLWGGFFSGSDANYIVTGQVNTDENNDIVVYRVTKYKKDWTFVKAAEVRGANTYIPFEAGRVSMEEDAGILYVRSCHQMYKSGDGLHHQANVEFVIDESTMKVLQQSTGVASQDTWAGYVSHSFTQYQTVLGGDVYALDHGDAYPRAVTVKRLGDTYGGYKDLLPIDGPVGSNATGVSVGGFSASEATGKLIAVGNMVEVPTFDYSAYDQGQVERNIWVISVDAGLTTISTRVLTSYQPGSVKGADTPFLVKLGVDRFMVLWGTKDTGDNFYHNSHSGEMFYAYIDGNGEPQGSAHKINGMLSDCQPIVYDGKVVWYASDGHQPAYYIIDIATNSFLTVYPIEGAAERAGFKDLFGGAWYMGVDGGAFPGGTTLYLDYTVDRGLMTGLSAEAFGPEEPLTRAQAAMVLFRLANPGVANGADKNETGLPDVADGQWYTRAVNWCFKNNVVTGYKDSKGKAYAFGPDDYVTREQLAVMIARYCMEKGGWASAGKNVSMFEDRLGVGNWAYEGMAFCNAHGIMTGMGGTKLFGVGQNATRAQMAKIIAVTDRLLAAKG